MGKGQPKGWLSFYTLLILWIKAKATVYLHYDTKLAYNQHMKFLLAAINAKFIHSNPAVYSLRACVGEELQSYVELAEFTINESLETILEGIWKRQPDVIGFSCYIWNWKLVQEILAELPKTLPQTES